MGHVIHLIDPNVALEWVHPLERDLPPEDRMTFHIKPLTEGTSRAINAANPATYGKDGFNLSRDTLMIELFIKCVTHIDNVQFPGEAQRRVARGEKDLRLFLNCLPAEFSGPIYDAIQNTGELEAGQEKNFAGSSDSESSTPA